MNRIKEVRALRNISQKELAAKLDITQQAISYYENGSRIPNDDIWQKISDILAVPIEYLKKETHDPDGWDLWSSRTGYSPEVIKDEIQRMKNFNHVVGDEKNLQNLIAQAVNNLDGKGNTDRGILNNITLRIDEIQAEFNDKYKDPKKIEKFIINPDSEFPIISGKIDDLIYDDLSLESYQRANEILTKARLELQNIPNDLKLK